MIIDVDEFQRQMGRSAGSSAAVDAAQIPGEFGPDTAVIERRIARLLNLPENWDGMGASRISREADFPRECSACD